jgi:small basic protein
MNLKEQSISPVSIMLFIHIIALSNFFHSELSNGFKNYIENNIVAKQLIIFLTILTIISQIYSNQTLWTNLFITIIIYFLLLFVTHSGYKFHVGIFVLLAICHLYQNKVKEKQKLELSDPNLNKEYKENIIKNNFNKEKIIYGLIIVLIIGGTIHYEQNKIKQFGKKFSLVKLLFS